MVLPGLIYNDRDDLDELWDALIDKNTTDTDWSALLKRQQERKDTQEFSILQKDFFNQIANAHKKEIIIDLGVAKYSKRTIVKFMSYLKENNLDFHGTSRFALGIYPELPRHLIITLPSTTDYVDSLVKRRQRNTSSSDKAIQHILRQVPVPAQVHKGEKNVECIANDIEEKPVGASIDSCDVKSFGKMTDNSENNMARTFRS